MENVTLRKELTLTANIFIHKFFEVRVRYEGINEQQEPGQQGQRKAKLFVKD